jgi:MarR family transcriptional repressor of emrRAB
MNNTSDVKYEDIQQCVSEAHQRLAGEALGDIGINILIKHSARLITDLLNRELKEYGLSYSSYVALMNLASATDNQVNPSVLCQRTGETRANMTRICDELVDLGLIRRIANSEDRRRVDLSLSDAGLDLLKIVVPRLRSHSTRFFSNFDESEKAVLKSSLAKVVAVLEAQL